MMRKLVLMSLVMLAMAGAVSAESVVVYPGNIGSGSLSVTGTGWKGHNAWLTPAGYDFANNRYSYDMSGGPVALQGFVDNSVAAQANEGDWSKYYAKFAVRDSADGVVNVVFANDWLGNWHELHAQPWDRISLETENVSGFISNSPHAQQYYATEEGVLGYDMDGEWVGTGNGASVYPSKQSYYFQLIADADSGTFELQVYGMGSSAEDGVGSWPKQNMFDEDKWLSIGSLNVSNVFDFSNVEFYSVLLASTQAGDNESSTVSWEAMNVGEPLSLSQTPVVPEPLTMLAVGSAVAGLGGYIRRRRRR